MSGLAKQITTVSVEDELKQSYLDYAMSVIVGRALPDVRDGLKPVHRRTLYAMHQLSNDWNKPYKKSARIVGDVIGKYHPHGDVPVYDTIVRMAQPFSLRYLLVDGQGNFGSVDGDAPAAMRYTEIRMTRFAHQLLSDIEKDTVDFVPNYDETEKIPDVLPTRIPNLLVNGSSGIAVGMATNIPPHNLNEVIDACIALIENPEMELAELMQYIPGPDFPTAGIIHGRSGIISAYKTGRGRIYVRAKTEIETDPNGKARIVVHELPFQVNKARLLEKIGELVRDKRIEGITGLRDESDKRGMRMVIELRRGEHPEVVLNNLYSHTQLQTVFGINIVALSQGQPQVLPLKSLLEAFIQHRREVVTRRTLFDLNQARQRIHLLEGLAVALANIDPLIALIKAAATPSDAKTQMIARLWPPGTVTELLARGEALETHPTEISQAYGLQSEQGYRLSPRQAQAILDLRLHRLTALETDKIHQEYQQCLDNIQELSAIIADPDQLHALIRTELEEIKTLFGDERRTEIIESSLELTDEDLITQEDLVVTLSKAGYIKAQSLDSYQAQHRGGRGKQATAVKTEDVVSHMLVANSHDTILCFSSTGKVYWLKTYQVPQGGRHAGGRPIVNLLPLEGEEVITTILPVREFTDDQLVMMATRLGYIKKVNLSEFSRPRTNGKIALVLEEKDQLIGAVLTDGQRDMMLMADSGKALRFRESTVRVMGRAARGVRGIKLSSSQHVIALMVVDPTCTVLTATEEGYGQRTSLDDYRVIGRGSQGVQAIQVNERNGKVVAALQVQDDDEVLLITDLGTLVRTRVNEISCVGRNTQGVRLINLSLGEKLVGVEAIRQVAPREVASELPTSENMSEEASDEDRSEDVSEDREDKTG